MNAPSNLTWQTGSVSREQRQQRNGHASFVVWFTGLSGAGKSTLAHALEARLHAMNCAVFVLDGDNVRHGLCANLGFSAQDRAENIRRVGEATRLMVEAGLITLTAFISPFRGDRQAVRGKFPQGEFIEVYCRCALATCEERDVKGLYQRARRGEIADFTGISSPYEEPDTPELILDTDLLPLEICVEKIMALLEKRHLLAVQAERCAAKHAT